MNEAITEMSLCTGAGFGLGSSLFAGWRTVVAVEINRDRCEMLEARRRDGQIDRGCEIFNMDLREFNSRVAASLEGKVGAISAGFPCQPFSCAGARRGPEDPRNLWPVVAETIRIVRPVWVMLENNPGLRNPQREDGKVVWPGYLGTVLGDLARLGYNAQWTCVSAADVLAPHLRKRVWLLANRNDGDWWAEPQEQIGSSREARNKSARSRDKMADGNLF